MNPKRSRLPLALVASFLVLAIGLAAVGWKVYRGQQEWLLDVSRRGMTGASRARAEEIVRWRRDRLAEAAVLQADKPFLRLSRSILAPSAKPEVITAWDESVAWVRTRADIKGATLLDASGRPVHSLGAVSETDRTVVAAAAAAARSRQSAVSDPDHGPGGKPRMFMFVPLALAPARESSATAVLVLDIDPGSLAAALKGRSMPASNSETLLVRRDADGLTVLAAAGSGKMPAVGDRFAGPLGGVALDRLVRGVEGSFDGPNLRGMAAVGDARRVGDTSWWVLSTIAVDAVVGQTSREARLLAGLIVLLIAAAGAVMLLSWQRRQAGLFRELYEAESGRQAIAESYRQLFDLANDGFVLADVETGVIIDANREMAELTGRTVEELRGQHHTVLHPTETADRNRSNMRGRASGELRGTTDVVLQHRDGRRIPAEVNASLVELRGRTAVLGIFRDLTDLEQSRVALRRSEEGYRVVAEQTGQLVYDIDMPSGVCEWRGAVEAITGYTPAEYAGFGAREWLDFIHPDDRSRVSETFDQAIRNLTTFRSEYRYRRKDGSHVWVDDHGACLPGSSLDRVRMIGTMRDVTADRAAEEELRSSETRRQKLESLALLAGGIAHDFNNLLVGIVGNVSLARDNVPPDSEAHACLVDAERAGSRAEDLTRQLLTFSKGGAPIKKVVDVGRLLRETVTFACRGTSVRCDVHVPAEPIVAELDEGQIAQVLNNIAINAVQAMPAGGVLTATASLTTVGGDNPHGLVSGSYVRLLLSDTGTGIPGQLLERIFDPYFTTKQKGSGLGLAISHSIVRRHGGDIVVRSEAGRGAEFEVLLPSGGKAEAESVAPPAVVLRRGGRVLVMDDEEQVRALAVRMVAHLGFDAEGAADGTEAIRLYSEARKAGRPFDAVIMDLTVSGGMGGKEAMAEIRAIDSAARGIVSSGYSNDPIMASYRDFGFSAILAKPYRLHQLKEALAMVLPA